MEDSLARFGTVVHFGVFICALSVMSVLELLIPRRPMATDRGSRWLANMSLLVLDTALLRILMPLLPLAAAVWAFNADVGLFNVVDMPVWIGIPLAVLILDFAAYGWHICSHKVPVLWRFHQVHHSDRDVDLTTAVRFHPIEPMIGGVFRAAIGILLGLPPLGMAAFEILLTATNLFSHGNIRLHPWQDAIMRKLVVTPDMHRVHHSTQDTEKDSNYGFCFAFWDRICGTYRARPEAGHLGMTLGLADAQGREPERLWWVLVLPFRKQS